jgi:hypothetical protein
MSNCLPVRCTQTGKLNIANWKPQNVALGFIPNLTAQVLSLLAEKITSYFVVLTSYLLIVVSGLVPEM